MPYYFRLGELPPKRHIQFRRPDGALYSEEVFGTEGFVGPTSTLYHINPPTQVTGWKPLYSTAPQYVETDTMRMRHLKTMHMKPRGDAVTGRVVLFVAEHSPYLRLHAEERKVRGAHEQHLYAFGLVDLGDIRVYRIDARYLHEEVRLLAIRVELRRRHADVASTKSGEVGGHSYQTIGIRKR